VDGVYKRLLDTCLVRFAVKNADSSAHKIAVRFVLDTFIGKNDGVPFIIPGESDLVDTKKDFDTASQVPDFISVLERPDLKSPGTIAQVNFNVGGKVEQPSRVSLTHWPGYDGLPVYDVPLEDIKSTDPADSAVAVYWDEQTLKAGKTRDVGFSYGLGSVSTVNGKLAVTVGGSMVKGADLTVVALVSGAKEDETLTLKLEKGLSLVGGKATQAVPQPESGKLSPVTWRVHADEAGTFEVRVTSSRGTEEVRRITIRAEGGVFD
jgi:hypothetical protein